MRWNSNESYEDKKARVLAAVGAVPAGSEVVVVGESAGGSVATTLFLQNTETIARLVTICGKNQNESTVGPRYARKHPALKDAVREADRTLASSELPPNRVRSIYSVHDEVVSNGDSVLQGAEWVKLRTPGHLLSIVYVVLVRFSLVAAAILKQA